jgi:hypothetical protein
MTSLLPTIARRLLAGAALLAALAPAHADILTFDAQSPALLSGGDTLAEAGFVLTALEGPYTAANGITSLVGAVLDAGSCADIGCPAGDGTRYYAGLNDGGVRLSRGDGRAFEFAGLDFGFVAANPLSGTTGQLLVTGSWGGGSTTLALDFPASDGAGNYVFAPGALSGFAGLQLTSVEIHACIFSDGTCVNSLEQSAFNEAQFALDNLNVTVSPVPEPSAWLALLAGLPLVLRRRRN